MRLKLTVWHYIVYCLLLWEAGYVLPASAQTATRAEEINKLYVEQSGGLEHIDSVFRALYQEFTYVRYVNYRQDPLAKPLQAKVTFYVNKDGRFLNRELEPATGRLEERALSFTATWAKEQGQVTHVDSSLYFEALWEAFHQKPCLIAPLYFMPECTAQPLRWGREDTFKGRLVDVLIDANGAEHWFARDTRLLVKKVTGSREILWEDYRQVEGVWLPFKETEYFNSQPASVYEYQKIVFCTPWPSSLFQP